MLGVGGGSRSVAVLSLVRVGVGVGGTTVGVAGCILCCELGRPRSVTPSASYSPASPIITVPPLLNACSNVI